MTIEDKFAEYVSKPRPTISYDNLVIESRKRYEPGTGPWSRETRLDQVDLVYLQSMAVRYLHRSDELGIMSGCIERLVDEVRAVRSWPTPVNTSKADRRSADKADDIVFKAMFAMVQRGGETGDMSEIDAFLRWVAQPKEHGPFIMMSLSILRLTCMIPQEKLPAWQPALDVFEAELRANGEDADTILVGLIPKKEKSHR